MPEKPIARLIVYAKVHGANLRHQDNFSHLLLYNGPQYRQTALLVDEQYKTGTL